mgnify:CR=1 FL=1
MNPLSRDLHPSNGRRAPKDEVVVSVARVAEGAAENGVLVDAQLREHADRLSKSGYGAYLHGLLEEGR